MENDVKKHGIEIDYLKKQMVVNGQKIDIVLERTKPQFTKSQILSATISLAVLLVSIVLYVSTIKAEVSLNRNDIDWMKTQVERTPAILNEIRVDVASMKATMEERNKED